MPSLQSVRHNLDPGHPSENPERYATFLLYCKLRDLLRRCIRSAQDQWYLEHLLVTKNIQYSTDEPMNTLKSQSSLFHIATGLSFLRKPYLGTAAP